VASVLGQKVLLRTEKGPLFPNLYTFLVGHAGSGKTLSIHSALSFIRKVRDISNTKTIHIAPTSMTMASLVDALNEAVVVAHPEPAYNSLIIGADELSAFMHDWRQANELVAGLTTFYDCVPYSQSRRTSALRIHIDNPQLNILTGSTPSNLMKFIPEFAWQQGFCSRSMFIYSEERSITDILPMEKRPVRELPPNMIADLKLISELKGEFGYEKEFAEAHFAWKKAGCDPAPKHPKLEDYNTRRQSHILKLAMVANIDRGDPTMMLTTEDWRQAMSWLIEAECLMVEMFRHGNDGVDGRIMDEAKHFVDKAGKKGVPERALVNFLRQRVNANAIVNIISIMVKSGMIKAELVDPNTDAYWYVTTLPSPE